MDTNDNMWFEQKLPFIRHPVPPTTVLHAVPFSANPEPPNHLIKMYRPTGRYDPHTNKYEYMCSGFE